MNTADIHTGTVNFHLGEGALKIVINHYRAGSPGFAGREYAAVTVDSYGLGVTIFSYDATQLRDLAGALNAAAAAFGTDAGSVEWPPATVPEAIAMAEDHPARSSYIPPAPAAAE